MAEVKTISFHYRAAMADGAIATGIVDAADEATAIGMLRQAGHVPLAVGTKPVRTSILHTEITLGGGRRLSTAEAEEFCQQLSTMLTAGLTLAQSLDLLVSTTSKRSAAHGFATRLVQGLALGRGLAGSVQQSGHQMPTGFAELVEAGEQTADLPKVLAFMAQGYRDSNQLRSSVQGALLYPAFLLVVSLSTVAILAFFVAPSLATLFASMNREPPMAIAVLSAGAELVRNHPLISLLLAALIAGSITTALVSKSVRTGLAAALYRIPGVGTALGWSAAERLATTLQLYVRSNLPLALAVENAVKASGLPYAERIAGDCALRLRGGESLTDVLNGVRQLPTRFIQLVRVGESTNRLGETLDAAIRLARASFEKRMSIISGLLAPILILLVGGLAGSIIYSVFSAMLEINNIAF